jgi:hypothetical protein
MQSKDIRDVHKIHPRRKPVLLLLPLALLAAVALPAATPQSSGTLRGDAILDHLNAVIDWYRHAMTRVQTVGLPSDAMYQSNAQSMAAEVAKLAFQSAQAEAVLLPAASAAGGRDTNSQQNLAKLQSDVNGRISALQAQISTLNQQIAGAHKAKLQDLLAQRERAQGELDLNNAMHQTFEQMSQFMTTNGESGTGGLDGSINELQRSVPELTSAGAKTAVKPPSTAVSAPSSTGLIGEVVQLYEQLQGMHQISLMMQETAHVKDVAMKLRSPLQATLRATIQQGQQLASQSANAPPAAPAQPGHAQPDQDRRQFDVLAARFKQIAGAAVPLREEIILLDQSSSNFLQWRQSVAH